MKIQYLGHSCFYIITGNKNLLFDPFITPNELASAIDISLLHPDYILLSHGHQDHVADTERILEKSDAMIISNYEIVSYYGHKKYKKGHPMNFGGTAQFDFGMVRYVQAVHSSVLPDGTYAGNPGGFVVKSEGKSVYFAGDTALTYDMKLLGEFEKLDVAILPIGDNFTMGIRDAIIAADFIKCEKIIGCHYDTFPYIKIDHQDAVTQFEQAGKELILMDIGQELEIS
jgi:L-ascorbate metabolism protein UlaG (beta-lactamase superfamily)